jgi:hypothetical protein
MNKDDNSSYYPLSDIFVGTPYGLVCVRWKIHCNRCLRREVIEIPEEDHFHFSKGDSKHSLVIAKAEQMGWVTKPVQLNFDGVIHSRTYTLCPHCIEEDLRHPLGPDAPSRK